MKLCAFADEASSDIRGQIAALKRNNFDFLEIRGVNKVNISKISVEDAKEVKKMLDDAGLSVWSMGSPLGKYGLDKDFAPHAEAVKRVVELSYIFEAKRIRMFSFHPVDSDDAATTKAKAFEYLDKLCALVPEDIILCHENEKRIFAETAETCLEVHKAFPRIRAVFDPANFVQCGVDTLKAWDILKDYVEYVHIKDALADGTVVPAGMGIGNVPAILKMYKEQGGSVVTLEPHLQEFTGLSALENGESVKMQKISYKDNDESFDAAANALKGILARI